MGQECRSCHAPIVWAHSEAGRAMPVDAEPVVGGTIILRYPSNGSPPVAHVITAEEQANYDQLSARHGITHVAFVSHFATCPQAAMHRRERP